MPSAERERRGRGGEARIIYYNNATINKYYRSGVAHTFLMSQPFFHEHGDKGNDK